MSCSAGVKTHFTAPGAKKPAVVVCYCERWCLLHGCTSVFFCHGCVNEQKRVYNVHETYKPPELTRYRVLLLPHTAQQFARRALSSQLSSCHEVLMRELFFENPVVTVSPIDFSHITMRLSEFTVLCFINPVTSCTVKAKLLLF